MPSPSLLSPSQTLGPSRVESSPSCVYPPAEPVLPRGSLTSPQDPQFLPPAASRRLSVEYPRPIAVYLTPGIDSPHVAAAPMAVAWHSRFPIPWTVVLRRNNCFLLF